MCSHSGGISAIDFSKEDGRETLDQIRDILQEDNYLVKVQLGKNYDFG